MSVENEAPVEQNSTLVQMDMATFNSAAKVYSHQEVFLETNQEIAIAFGIVSPFRQEGSPMPFVPHTVCYMTHEHFRQFAQVVNERLEKLGSGETE